MVVAGRSTVSTELKAACKIFTLKYSLHPIYLRVESVDIA
jgi:hypothetical protein